MEKKASHKILYSYIFKDYFQNFFVSFMFFFIIFFINAILLLVQRILLKNISMGLMVEMVMLNMPQFIIYIFPFAVLSSSSMVLGNLGSSNELLALRSSGISTKYIHVPLIIFSLLFTIVTFIFSDAVLPWSTAQYTAKLSNLMKDMPTFEIESNTVNTVGNIILSNGEADGNLIKDIVLLSSSDGRDTTVLSERGILTLIDDYNYVYSLELDEPYIMILDSNDPYSTGLSKSESAIFYLDFSSQVPTLTSVSPVKLSSKDLLEYINKQNDSKKSQKNTYEKQNEDNKLELSSFLKNNINASSEEISDMVKQTGNRMRSTDIKDSYLTKSYKAELSKKLTLSFACLCFTLIALPLSLIKVRHGRLTGFAISILLAVIYWYMLFGAQLSVFNVIISPYFVVAIPDLIILVFALFFMYLFRRNR